MLCLFFKEPRHTLPHFIIWAGSEIAPENALQISIQQHQKYNTLGGHQESVMDAYLQVLLRWWRVKRVLSSKSRGAVEPNLLQGAAASDNARGSQIALTKSKIVVRHRLKMNDALSWPQKKQETHSLAVCVYKARSGFHKERAAIIQVARAFTS